MLLFVGGGISIERHVILFLVLNNYIWSSSHYFSISLDCKVPENSSNLHSFLLRCGTRPYEWGTQLELNSLMKVCLSNLLTITPPESQKIVTHLAFVIDSG